MQKSDFTAFLDESGFPLVHTPWGEIEPNIHELSRRNAFRILKENNAPFRGDEGIAELLHLTKRFIKEPITI